MKMGFKVNTHEHLTDYIVRDTFYFDSISDAVEKMNALFNERVCAEVQRDDGAVVRRNYPNVYALGRDDSFRAWSLWDEPVSEETNSEIRMMMTRHKY